MVKCHSSKVNFSVRFWVSAQYVGRIGIQLGLISLTPQIRFLPPQLINSFNMEERKKILHSVTGESLREIVNFIKEREIAKEDLWMIDKDKGQYTLLYFK